MAHYTGHSANSQRQRSALAHFLSHDDVDSRCCSIFRRKRRQPSAQHAAPSEHVIAVDSCTYHDIVRDPLKDVLIVFYTDEVRTPATFLMT